MFDKLIGVENRFQEIEQLLSNPKIVQDIEKCIGCGACTTCDNWELKDDGKAHPKRTEADEIGCNQEAADICPVKCITIEEIE